MSRWMTAGIWAAHLAALVGKERLRVNVTRLERRLAGADEKLFAAMRSMERGEQQLSVMEKRLADAEEQCSVTAAKLTEVERQLLDFQSQSLQAQADVPADKHVELVEDAHRLRRLLAFLSGGLSSIFNVVLALFAALCLSVLVVLMNGRDEAKLLDFVVYCLSTVASVVAGGAVLIRAGASSAVDASARFYKLSALILICGCCVYLMMKDVAAASFYTMAGFVAFVFSSYLMVGLNWVVVKSWRLCEITKAAFYFLLWVSASAVAFVWAWMVSSEHPGVEITTEALRSVGS